TKHAKFWSWVAGGADASRLSLPGPRLMPWQATDMQPGPRPCPPATLRSSEPLRIGSTSLWNTPRLNLSTGAQLPLVGLVPALPLGSVIHASSAAPCVASTVTDLPLACCTVACT